MTFRVLDWIALILLIIGGIDLGLVGLINYDIIIDMFSGALIVAHSLFFLIGIAAVYLIFRIGKMVAAFKMPL